MKYFANKHDIKIGTEDSAGIDLPASLDHDAIVIMPHSFIDIDTKVHFELEKGYFGLVAPRSSIGTKKHLALQNTVGIIDTDYRGSIKLKFFNYSNQDVVIKDGEYVAQMIIMPFLRTKMERVENLNDLSKTDRGHGGFGSTN